MSEAKVISPLINDEHGADTGLEMSAELDNLPVNIIIIGNDGRINSINKASIESFKNLGKHLNINTDSIVNSYIYDIWNKLSEYSYSSSGNSVPTYVAFSLGEETIEIFTRSKCNEDGTTVGSVVVWNIVTKKADMNNNIDVLRNMLDLSPVNIMMADPKGNLTYLNKSARIILKTLESYLPFKVDDMVGKNIAAFHKYPERQA